MGRPKKRPNSKKLHLKRNIRLASTTFAILNARRFIFSIIVCGLSISQVREFVLFNDILPPSEATLYRHQPRVTQAIIDYAIKSCERNLERMEDNTVVAFDGSWSHRRNAGFCFVSMIDTTRKKVIDFVCVTNVKNFPHCLYYSGPSVNMELEGLKILLERLKTNKKIIGYCHDNDSKARKLITGMNLGWKESVDNNHMSKSFDRIFKMHAFIKPRGRKRAIRLLGEDLHDHLYSWFRQLVHMDTLNPDKKKELWVLSVDHICGNHEHCLHDADQECWLWEDAHDEEKTTALLNFLNDATYLFDWCQTVHSTQLNESLNAIKAHFADKNLRWQSSWVGRVACAVCQLNEAHSWKLALYRRLGLPELSPDAQLHLLNMCTRQDISRELKRDTNVRKHKNLLRKTQRLKWKKTSHDVGYRLSESQASETLEHIIGAVEIESVIEVPDTELGLVPNDEVSDHI